MKIPFLSLKDITAKYADEIHSAVSRVVDSGWYLQGEAMTEYLYSLFPNLGPFKDGWYYDQVVYRLLLVAAYQNNDYESAKEFDKTRLRPNKMSKMAKTYLTFKIYRYLRQVRRGNLQIF